MIHGARDIERKAFGAVIGLFGLVWLLNAAIQARAWLFAPQGVAGANLLNAFADAQAKAPAWLKPALTGALHGIQAVGPGTVAAVMVAIAAVLGLSLLTRRALAVSAVAGVIYSLVCWVLLDALGFPYTNGQTDPGVFIPYAIAFLFVLSVRPARGGAAQRQGRAVDPLWETARLLFGLLWAFDAALKWLPAFMFHFTGQITSIIAGQPQWIADWLHFVALVIVTVGPVLVAVVVALVETVIALSLLTGRGLPLFLPVAIVYSLAVWATAEAFGGPYSAAGTGVRGNVIGNVIIYLVPLLFLSAELYARSVRARRGARSGQGRAASHAAADPRQPFGVAGDPVAGRRAAGTAAQQRGAHARAGSPSSRGREVSSLGGSPGFVQEQSRSNPPAPAEETGGRR